MIKGKTLKIKVGDEILDVKKASESSLQGKSSDLPENLISQKSITVKGSWDEIITMEYYMKRGNSFYFRNSAMKLKANVLETGEIDKELNYGDTVNIKL